MAREETSSHVDTPSPSPSLSSSSSPPPPPSPPPRHRNDIDQKSRKTASIDWEPVPSIHTASHQDLPNKLFKDAFITTGRAKIQRELRDIGPYATHRQRLIKIAYISLMILCGIFLLNAVVVSLALWRCSKIQPDSVSIRRLELYDLEKSTARFSLHVDLPSRWYFSLFNVVLHNPTVIKVYAPEAVKNDEDKWTPLITITIPHFVMGRSARTIVLQGVPIEYGRLSLHDLIDYFADFRLTVPKRLTVRVEFEVETTSYWIPIRFSHTVQKTIGLPKLKAALKQSTVPILDSLEFIDQDKHALSVNLFIDYPHDAIPEYLYVKIPELFMDVGYFTDQRNAALASNLIGQIKVLSHTITGNPNGITNATVQVSVIDPRKDALATLLGKIREGDFSWSLACGMGGDSLQANHTFLQKWLASLSYDMPMYEIARQLQVPLSRFEKRSNILEIPALKVGLVEIDGHHKLPRAVFCFSIENHYLRSLLGGNLPKIKGTFPKLAIKVMVDKTGEPSIEIFNVDIVHLPRTSHLKFLLYTGIVDISMVVKAIDKASQMKLLDKYTDLVDYNSIYLHISGDRILDKLLRVFEIQFALIPGGGLSFRHGSRRTLAFPIEISNEIEMEHTRHDIKLDITSDTHSVRAQGGITLNEKPAIEAPYIYIYWNAMDFSIFPEAKDLQHVELIHSSVIKGSARASLSSVPILKRFYQGSFDFDITFRHSDEIIDGVPALIKAWRHMATQFVNPKTFPHIHVVGRIGDRKIDFPSCFPSRSQLLVANTDVPRWVTDVIKTRVKIAGFTDAILQVLLELPALGHCSDEKRQNHNLAVSMQLSLPAINANGCLYPKIKGKEQISCVATVGLHPIVVGLELFDGEFCDIKTRLAKPNEHVYERKLIENESYNNDGPKANLIKSPPPELFLGDEEGTLINYLPLSAAITDFRRVMESADKLIGSKNLRRIKTSVGFSDRKSLLSNESPLLDRFINGVGQALPLILPLYSRKKGPKRPPVTRFFKKKPLKIQVDISSTNRRTLKGKILMRLPEEVLPSMKAISTPDKASLALLLVVQWGRTLLSLNHGGSWLKARISQGQVTFRLDESRVRLGRHHGIPFTSQVKVDFALHANSKGFSTATLRRIMAHLYNFTKRRAKDTVSRRVLKTMPSKHIEFILHTLPYSTRRGGLQTSEYYLKKHGNALKQKLRISTVVEMGQRIWKHMKHRSGVKLNHKMVIKPRPYPNVHSYRLPCFLPTLCDPKELNRNSPSKKFISAEISLLNAIQPIMNIAATGMGMLLDKLNFRLHPKYLAVSIRISALRIALAINDLDVVEVNIEPIIITRVAALAYPQHNRPKKRNHNDILLIMAHIKLAKKLALIGNFLRPFKFTAGMSTTIDPVPKFIQGGRRIPIHYSHLNIALTTERIKKANMLSTLVAIGLQEMPVSPMISSLGKGDIKIHILRTSKDGMEMKISGILIPNPVPFAVISLDHPISLSYVYKGYEFARVRLGKLTLVPGENLIKAYIMVSKSAFGKLNTKAEFIPELNEFLGGLALAQPLKVTAIIHIGRKLHMRSHLSFPKGSPAMGAFNPKNSYVDFRDVHDILNISRDAPRVAWYAAKHVSKRIREDVGTIWGWTKNWFGGIYNWTKTKVLGIVPKEQRQNDNRGKRKKHWKRAWYHPNSSTNLRVKRRPVPLRPNKDYTDEYDDLRPSLGDKRSPSNQKYSALKSYATMVYDWFTGWLNRAPAAKKDEWMADEDSEDGHWKQIDASFERGGSEDRWGSKRSASKTKNATYKNNRRRTNKRSERYSMSPVVIKKLDKHNRKKDDEESIEENDFGSKKQTVSTQLRNESHRTAKKPMKNMFDSAERDEGEVEIQRTQRDHGKRWRLRRKNRWTKFGSNNKRKRSRRFNKWTNSLRKEDNEMDEIELRDEDREVRREGKTEKELETDQDRIIEDLLVDDGVERDQRGIRRQQKKVRKNLKRFRNFHEYKPEKFDKINPNK